MDTKVVQLSATDRLLAWYDENKQQAMLGALIVVLLGIGLGFFFWRTNEKDVASGQALTAVTLSYTGPGGGLRSGASDQLLKVANDYPGSKAGSRALLLAAGNLYVDGKYDEARKQFERFTREYKDSTFMGEALLGDGVLLRCAEQDKRSGDSLQESRGTSSGRSLLFHRRSSRWAVCMRQRENRTRPKRCLKMWSAASRARH